MYHSAAVLLAYLDPGTGAIVLQVVFASVLATGVFFRRFLFAPVLGIWGKLRGIPTNAGDDETDN